MMIQWLIPKIEESVIFPKEPHVRRFPLTSSLSCLL